MLDYFSEDRKSDVGTLASICSLLFRVVTYSYTEF